MRFEWDESKNLSNRRKHGVDFAAAEEAFSDPLAKMKQDRYVDFEERWQGVGAAAGRLLVVAFTVKEAENEETVRIVSARDATRAERRDFERGARETDR
jgi:uncharacterized DUF497 family protein